MVGYELKIVYPDYFCITVVVTLVFKRYTIDKRTIHDRYTHDIRTIYHLRTLHDIQIKIELPLSYPV